MADDYGKKVSSCEDCEVPHDTYKQGMDTRTAMHEALLAAGYRKGSASLSESEGSKGKRRIDHEHDYSHHQDKRATLRQSFEGNKGDGNSHLKFVDYGMGAPVAASTRGKKR